MKANEREENSMRYDLLVVGNGFDLGCGFKTSYRNFLDKIGSQGNRNPLITFFISADHNEFMANEEWNGFESLLCQYLQFLDYCFRHDTNIQYRFSDEEYAGLGQPFRRYFYWTIEDINLLPNNIRLVLDSSNPLGHNVQISVDGKFTSGFNRISDYPGLKALYFRVYVNATPSNYTREYALKYLLNLLEEYLLDLEDSLKKYIREVTQYKTEGPISFLEHGAERVVSFNYSDTAQRIYGLSGDKVAYIHGSVLTKVVVGVEPSMISNQTFDEKTEFVRFFKRFRRILFDCNQNYNHKIFEQLDSNSKVAIYGHSLNLSDKSILTPLFEKKYQHYDIYCYKSTDEYKMKVARLIGLDLFAELVDDNRISFIEVD